MLEIKFALHATAVFVRFDGKTFKIGDLPEGVYPCKPHTETWFVDAKAAKRQKRTATCSVSRRQFPLTAGDSATTTSLQGTNKNAVVLTLERSTSQTEAYVALTRTHAAEEMLVVKPFPKALFQQGPRLEVDLLHAKLRGEDITERLNEYESKKQQRKEEEKAQKQQQQEDANHARRSNQSKHLTKQQQGEKAGAAKLKARCKRCKECLPLAQFSQNAVHNSTNKDKNDWRLICLQCAESRKDTGS